MLQLLKMQATGNDFLILDAMGADQISPKSSLRPQLARSHCHRTSGFGADGFLVLEKVDNQIQWDFYNSDGSPAKMCGNAARAVARYLMAQSKSNQTEFQTAIGLVTAKKIDAHTVEVQFEIPATPVQPLPSHSAQLVDSGVPHAVIKTDDLKNQTRLKEIGLQVKANFPDGMNVTFYTAQSDHAIEAVTFERGVEEFTLSCGTGALAAARVHLSQKNGSCEVRVPGGNLHVTFDKNQAILRGEARYIGWCTPVDGDFA